MHRFTSAALAGTFLLLLLPLATAQDQNKDEKKDEPQAAHKDENVPPIPPEKNSVTHHEMVLDGRTLRYTATAGTLLIRNDDDKPYGSVFYVAYTLDGVTDAKTRPLSFLYNGGPGSSTIWLHMGSVGPMRVVTQSPEATGPAPYQLVPNQYSLLDKTDLVFIDAVGTGFSKPVGKGTQKDFSGTDQDVKAFDKFIQRYVTLNQRWNSPKFLFGESYGTTRSAMLADSLEDHGMTVNGVILVSTVLNYGHQVPGLDSLYINDLPSYAAIAWYHNKLSPKPADLQGFLKEVRGYAQGPYAEALSAGDALSPEQVNTVAAKVSSYTGLSADYIKEANLRVSPARFRKELLRGDREILGRYDARFEGTDVDAAGDTPGYDPSSTGISGAYVSAFHDYLSRELKYESDDSYMVSGRDIIRTWEWKHHLPGSNSGFGDLWLPYVAGDLADAMRKNPKLKVFSANGLFDLATPFFATEYDLAHMGLDAKLRGNVQFGYYPSGHMIYLNVDALKQLRGDLESFYSATAQHP